VVRTGVTRIGVLGADARGLLIGVAAAPERGKANAELIRIIAQLTQVRQSAVELVAGATSRHKSVRVWCDSPAGVAARLAALVTQKRTSNVP
jgi:uncharacterized protein